MTLSNQLKLFAVTAIFALTGCGAANMVPGDAGVVGESNWLYGTWNGTYTRINPSNGATLYSTPAKAKFAGKDQQTGEFEIKLEQRGDSEVTGAFQAEGADLYFGVKETNAFTLFGSPGDTSQYTYELSGKTLLIYNANGTFDLVAKVQPKDDNEDDEDKPKPSPGSTGTVPTNDGVGDTNQTVVGNWTCTDASDNSWQINFPTDGEFRIDITTPAGSLLWMQGGYIAIDKSTAADALKPYDAILTAASSNLAAYRDLKLFMTRTENGLDVTIPNQGEEPTVIACAPKE